MNKKLMFAGLVAASAFVVSSGVSAALSVKVSDGTTSKVINEDAYGQIAYIDGLFGTVDFANWDLKINANGEGYYDLINPAANFDQMHYDSVDVKAGTGASTLTIMFTETDLLRGDAGFMSKYGGVLGGENIRFESYIDTSNAAFGLAQSLADSGLITDGSFSGSEGGSFSITGPYSWTTVVTITHNGAGQTTSFNYDVKIPEPSTVALLGLGMLGFGFASRRKRKA